jgi:6-bladed beta-propeller
MKRKKTSIMMKIVMIFICVVMVSPFGFAKKLTELTEILKPERIEVGHGRIFISEGANIYIYRLNDFSLIRKIGSPGEGPQEFKLGGVDDGLKMNIDTGQLFVNSISKISYFTLDGEFIKELKVPFAVYLSPQGKSFVGMGFKRKDKTKFRVVFQYDEKFRETKQLFRIEHYAVLGKMVDLLKQDFAYHVAPKVVYISHKPGLNIDVVGADGKLLRTISDSSYDIKRPVTSSEKKAIRKWFLHRYKEYYEVIKDKIRIADFYPTIQGFVPDGDKLVVLTYNKKGEDLEWVVFDANGKLSKKVFLPISMKNVIEFNPLAVHNGKLYQLVENSDTDNWELHSHDF